jgi:hypothetical protein
VLQNDLYPTGATVTAALGTPPAHGAFTLHADGSFDYTPTGGYTGSDQFTYVMNQSGGGTSAPATVYFDVRSDDDDLQQSKGRQSKGRQSKGREIDEASLVTIANCRSRFVWVNPQVTLQTADFLSNDTAIATSTFVRISASLFDAAGQRVLATNGYILNDTIEGDPFQPKTLTFPVWVTSAPAGGKIADVLVELDPDTPGARTISGSVACET